MDVEVQKNIDKLSKIKETFKIFSDSLDMIAYLIDLGKSAHNLSFDEKNEDNIISGCTSNAWIIISQKSNDNYIIRTDSDSHIVSGLLYLLCLTMPLQL